uniref:Putative ribonuclease H-like domain-containing protein n=1 Tax=Tanacetum cinerariifolium TaxID=118510 RepID=A0A6L2M407_TANCI|nr:putative ribonuclease H-like domain-containing protein [Tanacetum cinerariifolium]
MALLVKHQLKFNIYKNAKSFMEAIEKRIQKLISQLEILGESISKEDINMKFLRSLPSEWRTHTLIWRNKADLGEQSLDDLFNNLKIYEAEVKSSSTSSQTTPNIAFVSSNNTNSTNESVNAIPSVTAASSKAPVSTLPNMDNLSDTMIYSFFARYDNHVFNSQVFNYDKLDSSESDDSVPTSPVNDRYKSGEGYHAVPPHYTGTLMPSKPDLVFHDAPPATETVPNVVHVESNTNKTSKEMSKTFRPNAPIIEDWTSDSKDESELESVSNQKEPSFVQISKHVKNPRASVKTGNPQQALKDKGFIDSGCSRHITGNISYLSEFEEINGGYVVFGRNPKGGKITGKDGSAAKLLILNPNEFDLWNMRIEQYFLMTDYSLWEVILNGDSPMPTTFIDGVVQPVAPTTAEQRLARKNELKDRGTLLMALPDKHQLKFNIRKDAKSLMEAIEKWFGGNKETKKVQKTLLKQQYENFTGLSSKSLDQIYDRLQKLINQLKILKESLSQEDINLKFLRSLPIEWRTHTLIWRNKIELEDQILDDLFNSLKIYEVEVKISAVTSVSDASTKVYVSALPNVDTLSEAVIYSLFASQSNSPHLDNDDLKQIDVDDLEEMDLKWQMAMLNIRAMRFLQRTRRNLGANGTTSIGFNMSKVECYNCHRRGHFAKECKSPKDIKNKETPRRNVPADEEPINYALMAFTSFSSLSSDNENENVFEEDIKLLKLNVMLRDNALVELRKKFEKAKQERDELKLKLENFQTSVKNLSQLLSSQITDKTRLGYDNQVFNSTVFDSDELISSESDVSMPASPVYDRYKSGEGYHVVPPPYTGTFMPPKPDLVFHDAPTVNETVPTIFIVEPSATKPNKDLSQSNRPSASIIKDWVSDSEDEYEVEHPIPDENLRKDIPKNVVPTAVLTRSRLVPLTFARPVPIVVPPTKGNPQHALKDKGVIDSGCSRHLTRNISYLSDFEEINGGYVAFGGNPKGGKITRKGKIKTGKLDFDDIYFIKELKFNLFSVSQMCDKKNNVLFTDTESIVLSSNFKLPDENHALLRVPRENNMYNVDLKNIVPSGDLTCIFAKATLDESNLLHRRLGHINFKIMNKLVKVNTACYVQNRVLVTKPHNKTPYELLLGRTPSIGFMRPFGCSVTILNTLDPLGKFDGKADKGYLVRYSVSSKAFRVFNSRTKIVQETLHINFLENQPNVVGSGPTWLFDIDTLTQSMNYQPVVAGNQPNSSADPQHTDADATFEVKEPESKVHVSPSNSNKTRKHDHNTKREAKGKSHVKLSTGVRNLSEEFEDFFDNSINEVNAASTPVTAVGQNLTNSTNTFSVAGPSNTVEGGIDYEEVFAPVARIEAIRLFLAYASFMGFMVYKVVKAIYGLHQALRAWSKTLANYLLENGFQRKKIDQTLFIKKQKGDILLVQVYVDDIIFGSTNKDLCKAFEKLMKDKFKMSLMGELTFFLGLQVKHKQDGIFISQDKYVAKILRKFGLTDRKSASTSIDTEKPLLKDPDGEDVDVHTYR